MIWRSESNSSSPSENKVDNSGDYYFLDFWRIEVKKNHANIILLCSRVDIRRKINHYAPLNEKMHTTESFRKEFHIQVISVHTLSHVTEST